MSVREESGERNGLPLSSGLRGLSLVESIKIPLFMQLEYQILNQVFQTGPSFLVLDLHLIEGYNDNDSIGDELCVVYVVPKLCGVYTYQL